MNTHGTDTPNRSIHCGDAQFCALESIQVGTHEEHPTQAECTDCMSFRVR